MTNPDLSSLTLRQRAGLALHGLALKLNPSIAFAATLMADQRATVLLEQAMTEGRYVPVPNGARAVMISDQTTAALNSERALYDIAVMPTTDPLIAHLFLQGDMAQEMAAAKWAEHVKSTAAQQ